MKLWMLVALAACGGTAPPRATGPMLFGEGVFSTPAWDFFVALAPDERYALFGRADDKFEVFTLYETRRVDAGWSTSPDGRWLYFSSPRRNGKGDIYRISMEEVMPAQQQHHAPIMMAPGGAYALTYEVAAPARTIYISGQIPTRPDGTVPEGFEAQCRAVWANIDAQLAAAGMTRRDLVKVTTFLSDRKYRDTSSRIRRELLGDHFPALTIIITGIYDEEWLLEIEAIASR